MKICIVEDLKFKNFFPLVNFIYVSNLQSGCFTLKERVGKIFKEKNIFEIGRNSISKIDESHISIDFKGEDEVLFLNSRVIFTEKTISQIKKKSKTNSIFVNQDDEIVCVKIPQFSKWNNKDILFDENFFENDFKNFSIQKIEAKFFNYVWDIIHFNFDAIKFDFKFFKKKKVFKNSNFVNSQNIILGKKVSIGKNVVLDATDGPIVIDDNVTIMHNAVIIGPTYVGKNSIIKVGAKIYGGTTIGNNCKIGGEIENTIIQSYSNKQHDGFLGHSFIGSWVNLGANTNTSDLKNNYGFVKVNFFGESINTQLKFLGSIIGDHSKTSINTMLNTGNIIGIFSNIFGFGFPKKFIPNFSWCENGKIETYDLEKSIETAKIVMQRRNVNMSLQYENEVRKIFKQK